MTPGKERKHSKPPPQTDLQTSEIRYRRLFESARDGILILDAITSKITDVNPFLMKLLGYTEAELLGKELWEIGILKDKEASVAAFEELKKNDYIRYDDLPLKNKDGGSREVEFVSNVYTENERQVIQCNIRDITKRKSAEKSAWRAESNYRKLIESSTGIIYVNQPEPPYSPIYISPNIKTIGYSPEEWCAEPNIWINTLHKEDLKGVLEEYQSASNGSFKTEFEYRLVGRDGAIHWCHDKGRLISDEKGKRLGWQGIILDVTKTKELEQNLRQAQKLESVGLLAGGIAHDFNNMLTVINGNSDLVLLRLKADDPLRRNIEQIKKAGWRSAALTHQLLAFSRQQILQPVVLDLNEIIVDTIKMLKRLISEDIQLTLMLNPNAGRVLVDPGQFSQIVMNLAVNARDAMPHGGELKIETASVILDPADISRHFGLLAGAYVELTFSDTGSGMNEETRQHIFEPFFTTKEIDQGTGLGLATVYGIVKQSGGLIEVESELDVGTTFKIYLPRLKESAASAVLKDAVLEMPGGTETILLVEDDEQVRNLSKEILETCGYTVIEARNGIEVLEICDHTNRQFDLLITDVVMPQMGGQELVKNLKAKLPNLRILFISGYTVDAVVSHGVIEANTNFIQKPFSPREFANKIRHVLDM